MRRFLTPILTLIFIAALIMAALIAIPAIAAHRYGRVSPALSGFQAIQYAAKVLWYDSSITRVADPYGIEQNFLITEGESPYQIAIRLENAEIITDAQAFTIFLIYTGADTALLPGNYRLSPSYSMQNIAGILQDARASQITFVILPGWRMEEVAASLPTSGLFLAEETFLREINFPPPRIVDAPQAPTAEGFLFPDTYLLPREITAPQLLNELTLNFARHLTPDIKEGFAAQGLTTYEGIILASVIEKEAVIASEQAMIASVFFNRLRASQKLESDPTVQYALGYDDGSQSWWKNPLTYDDLAFDSPYNAYLYHGLPPTPICNPSLDALKAAAFPAESPYFYFRARCDGSGLHNFAVSFEEHLANGCE